MLLTEQDKSKFWSRVQIKTEDECWPWIGRSHTRGYGQICLNGKRWVATEIALLTLGQERVGGLMILHTCDNKGCCNPKHLYWGTQTDNMRDRSLRHPGWGNGGRNSRAWKEAHAALRS